MSHQSLKDLTDVTGSPTDGQILKYTASSSSWGPAAESGGGSSGAEYLELYQDQRSVNSQGYYYVKQAAIFANAPAGTIMHNSLPAAVAFKRANAPTGINYSTKMQSSDYDDVFWFRPNSSDKYIVELDYLVKYNSSSMQMSLMAVDYEASTSTAAAGTNNKLFQDLSHSTELLLQSLNDVHTLDSSETTYIDPEGYAGRIQRIVLKYSYSPDGSSSSAAQVIGLMQMRGPSWSGSTLEGNFKDEDGYTRAYTIRKHVKITKIA